MLGRWKIKSQSTSDRVWAFYDQRNREIGLTASDPSKYYKYEWFGVSSPPHPTENLIPSSQIPNFPNKIPGLANIRAYLLPAAISLLIGAISAILILVIVH